MSIQLDNVTLDDELQVLRKHLKERQERDVTLTNELCKIKANEAIVRAKLQAAVNSDASEDIEKYAGELGGIHREMLTVGAAKSGNMQTIGAINSRIEKLEADQ